MIDKIVNQVKGQLTGELQSKFNLDAGKANRSVDLAKDNLTEGLKKEAVDGDFGGIMDLLQGKKAVGDNPVVNSMISNYVGDLTSKLGIPDQMAKQVGPFVVSFLMQKFAGQVTGDGLSKLDIIGLLGGGVKDKVTKGLGDKLGGLFK
ncbi:hypothetical protein FVR03_18145 [Pontibacter qinzhouensis]|uniref:DUF937 domain-containing protein n=1 Tax=Pontibacter qinzhouensis TaxID=2603253 RepID=A0A5C8J8W2_9BACT|nr:hypothetical protein [Pontibacter qinzhouensis]TXK33882.1 hypothetical protein FVR03_18145 [Pontibacter qinzhouensis]